MLLDDLKDPNDAKVAADRLMKALKAPFHLAGKEVVDIDADVLIRVAGLFMRQ